MSFKEIPLLAYRVLLCFPGSQSSFLGQTHTTSQTFARLKAPFTANAEIKYVTFFPGQEKGVLIAIYLMKILWTVIPLKNMEYVVENTEL